MLRPQVPPQGGAGAAAGGGDLDANGGGQVQQQAAPAPAPRLGHLAKIPQPRTLSKSETLDSLNQWKTTVRNFYRRDEHFKRFLQAGAVWDPSANHHGFQAETEGLRRSAEDIADDLNVFLNLISGFLPFSFLKEKLELESKSMADVWSTIFEVYGHEITQDSFLDMADMPKEDGETHRQYFERISSHVRRHLTPPNVTAAGMTSGLAGDTFSITLGNMVVAHWMKLTDPRLVKLVRLEYAAELKQGVQLVDLLPRIAKNVDTLLSKAEAAINSFNGDGVEQAVEAHLNRIGFEKRSQGKKQRPRQAFKDAYTGARSGQSGARPESKSTCHHCEFLNQKLKSSFNTNHSPETCFRQKHSVRLIDADEVVSDTESDTGQSNSILPSGSNLSLFQSEDLVERENVSDLMHLSDCDVAKIPVASEDNVSLLSDSHSSAIRALQAWKEGLVSQKAASPSLQVDINGNNAVALVDEGANLNCLDLKVAKKNRIKFLSSDISAKSAGSNKVVIAGICATDLVICSVFGNKKVLLNLGRAVVVPDLGVDVLIGEPGKRTNALSTNSVSRVLSISLSGEVLTKPYLGEG